LKQSVVRYSFWNFLLSWRVKTSDKFR